MDSNKVPTTPPLNPDPPDNGVTAGANLLMGLVPERYRTSAGQLFRFGIVGVLATVTHVTIVTILVEVFAVPVLTSNFFAFCTAVFVSYFGNLKWVFGKEADHRSFFPRFVFAAVTGLGLNQGIMYLLVERLGWDYRLGLAVVIFVVPFLTFLMNRFWVFRTARS